MILKEMNTVHHAMHKLHLMMIRSKQDNKTKTKQTTTKTDWREKQPLQVARVPKDLKC